MGVERAVTRWHIHRQTLLQQIATLEEKIAHPQPNEQAAGAENTPKEETNLEEQLANARVRLHDLGPCPRPMMG